MDYSFVAIYPNINDDWESSSPFSGYSISVASSSPSPSRSASASNSASPSGSSSTSPSTSLSASPSSSESPSSSVSPSRSESASPSPSSSISGSVSLSNSPSSSPSPYFIEGFAFATITTASAGFSDTFTLIPNKLTSLGAISREFDPIGSTRSLSDNKIEGLGGVSKVNDFTFSIENIGSVVDPLKLLGRRVKFFMGTGSTLDISATCKFVGRIYNVEPNRKELIFTVRGQLQLWNKTVGTLTNFNSEVYKNKIYPITYGDFSDVYGYIPAVLNKDTNLIPDLVFSDKNLKTISDLYCWDDPSKQGSKAITGSDITFDSNFKYISMQANKGLYLVYDITNSYTQIDIWNPPTIIFEVSSVPSLDAHGVGVVGSIYEISGDSTKRYEFISSTSTFLIFTAMEEPTTISGTLDKVSGTGPATISFIWRSSIRNSSLVLETYDETYTAVTDSISNIQSKPSIIKVDNEYIYLYKNTDTRISNRYGYSSFTCSRGYQGSTKAAHTILSDVYLANSELSASKWLIKKDFPISSIGIPRWVSTNDYYTSSMPVPSIYNASGVTDVNGLCEIKIITTGVAEGPGLLVIDINFAPTDLQGDIQNIYLKGFFNVRSPLYYSSTAIVKSILLMGKGDKPIPSNSAWGPTSLDYGAIPFAKGVGNRIHIREDRANLYDYSDSDTQWSAVAFNYMRSFSGTMYEVGEIIFDNVSSSAVDAETDFSLYDPEISEVRYGRTYLSGSNGLIGNINQLESTRYFLAWYIYYTGLDDPGDDFWIEIGGVSFLIYFYVDPIKNQFWGRGQGRVDGSNNLIENPVSIVKDLLQNEVGVSSEYIGDFTTTETARSGWKMALTKFDSQIDLISLLDKICKQGGIGLKETYDGLLTPFSLTVPTSSTGLTVITSSRIVVDDTGNALWSQEYTSIDRLITALQAKYQLRNTDGLYMSQYNSTDSNLTIARNSIDEDRQVTIDLDCIRDVTTVGYLSTLMIRYLYKPIRIINMECTLDLHAISEGDWVRIIVTNINTAGGIYYLVTKVDLQPGYLDVKPSLKLTMWEF